SAFLTCWTSTRPHDAETAPGCTRRQSAGSVLLLAGRDVVRSGIGPTAYVEFERVFGPRALGRWPTHRVLDGLDQLEVLLDRSCLLIHPRCVALKAALQNYARKRSAGGDWLDEPSDPQHPHASHASHAIGLIAVRHHGAGRRYQHADALSCEGASVIRI